MSVFQKTTVEKEHCGPEVSRTRARLKVGRDFSRVLIKKAWVQKQVRVLTVRSVLTVLRQH